MSSDDRQADEREAGHGDPRRPSVPVFQRVIASLQILGASSGALFLLGSLGGGFGLGSGNLPLIVVAAALALAMLAFIAVAVIGGLWLWQADPRGKRLSIIVQALQIPIVLTPLLHYKMFLGFAIALTYSQPGSLNAGFWFGSNTTLVVLPGLGPTVVGVNLFAPIALAYLLQKARPSG